MSGEGTKDINAALRAERLDLGLGMLSENVPIPKDLQVIPLTHDYGGDGGEYEQELCGT